MHGTAPRDAEECIRREPEDTDHGSRQFVVHDPEGDVWGVGTWYE
jgi:uncharacterized glyoxalase superfamily protein PhnB